MYIVDDKEAIRDSLVWLAGSLAMAVAAFDSAEAFLTAIEHGFAEDKQGDCLLLDVRMPEMSGVELFDILVSRNMTKRLPVIFLSGHVDVRTAVDTLKRGAFDFFEKPFDDVKLMHRIAEAFAASREAGDSGIVRDRLSTLSQREREVLDLIVAGKINKVIGDKLGISIRTVEVHRSNIFSKMRVKSAVELIRLLRSTVTLEAGA